MRARHYLFFIARRYLAPSRRNRFLSFMTAIAVLGVAFGTTALLVSLSIIDGFDRTLQANMVSFLGHIDVTSFSNRPLNGYRQVVERLPEQEPEVVAVSPYVRREAVLRSRAGLEGVLLKGVDPSLDVSTVGSQITQGTFDVPKPEPGELPGIVIGERLSWRLEVTTGDTLVVFAVQGLPSPDNPPVIEQFVLKGVYRTGMAEYDDVYAYTSLRAAQILFGYRTDQVSGYNVLVKDLNLVDEVADRLDTALGYPHYPQTAFDLFRQYFAWLDLQRAPIPIVLGLLIIVAVFNVASTLLVVVFLKSESIGVLSTLGSTPGDVMKIFLGQGLLIGGVGTALGAGISLAFTLLQINFKILALDPDIYLIDAVPVALTGWHYLLVVLIAMGLSVVSTVMPAYIASRLRPVEALRFR